MKLNKLTLLITSFISVSLWSQEILSSGESGVKDKVMFSDSTNKIVGNGFFPLSYTESNQSIPDKEKSKNWFVRKVFYEHLIHKKNEDFIFIVDPLVNVSIGSEQLQNTSKYLFQNTRGAQAMGQLKDKLSFYTAFYENQARFVDYQSNYFINRGELYPSNGDYAAQNAVVPGGGRTKAFKTNGFDYASAVSYVRLTPIKQLSIQFGNMPRFYGWGHRSMLLSDNSYNYTNLTIDWEINDVISYSFMRGKQLNLRRKVYTNMVESPYERKGIGVHYLTLRLHPSLVIGLFESSIYLKDEAKSYQRVNPYFYQPLIGLNSLVKGAETSDMKNLFGFNIAWQPHNSHLIYMQGISDDLKNSEYGFQLGYRVGNLTNVGDLHLQLETNLASSNLYAAENKRMNYTHFNLPLAHTLGNGFKEFIIRASYQWERLFVDGKIVYYMANQPIESKTSLFDSKSVSTLVNETQVMNANFEFGYEFNPLTRLRMFMNFNYRTSSYAVGSDVDYGMVSIGIRSALSNQYFDF